MSSINYAHFPKRSIDILDQMMDNFDLMCWSCSAEYDLRLSRHYNTTEGFWLRLQTAYQIRRVKAEKGKQIKEEVQPAA